MFKVEKRNGCSKTLNLKVRISAVILALLTSALFVLIMDKNPIDVYGSMINGAFGTSYRIHETFIKSIPLIITSIGISIAFRMKFWNIGAEGQIMMGAFAATFMALTFDNLPSYILLPLMFVSASIMGGLWGLIPGYFKARFKTNETIFTLMMNYVAIKWITYLQYGPWKDPKSLGFPKIRNFTENGVLPNFLGIHLGWVIALLIVVFIHFYIKKTKSGFEINVVGESENTARYAGMNVKAIIMRTIFLSGAICGIAGMIQASAVNKTLNVQLSGGVGYTAIITAWLSGLSAPIIIVVSFLFAAMVQGGTFIQLVYQIPQSAAEILQGMILFFVLGSEFFIRFKLVKVK
ncbi:MAG: branched-chain amino acid ABC transporter permease [Candidatus Cloacimonadota bacterium]|nr:MAG: branched-chain amino acid ABC transporter permease [Candidatus Cloacimonadota bacterium]PIE78158.1 MAG: branched-chain amino acid ABC transporter permease [Candidatus Delongbacteria bacterium]